jgi:acid phosphatase
MPGRKFLIAILLLLSTGCRTTLTRTPPKTAPPEPFRKPQVSKVVLIIFENKNADPVGRQSFFGKLAREGANFTNFYALAHPSQPNYIALVSGSTDGVRGNSNVRLERSNLGQKLKSWKSYAEGYPKNPNAKCDLRPTIGRYARKHEPFLSFADIQDSSTCEHITDLEDFFADAKAHQLPDFSLIIPDLDHDAHDKPIQFANDWFRDRFTPIIEDAEFKRDVLFIITFDENDTKFKRTGNRIYTVFWGDGVIQQTVPDVYDHYDLLRTLEEIFGVSPMTQNDGNARPIAGVLK